MLYAQIKVHPDHYSVTGSFLYQPGVQALSLSCWDRVCRSSGSICLSSTAAARPHLFTPNVNNTLVSNMTDTYWQWGWMGRVSLNEKENFI